MNTFRKPLDAQGGYVLPAMAALVLPEAGTNLIANPSVETNTTGYSAVGAGAAIARAAGQGRRGTYGLQITPAAGVACGAAYTVSVTDGQYYTFAVDLCGKPGKTYYLEVFEATRRAYKEFRATGYWQRIWLSFQARFTSAAAVARVMRAAYAGDTTPYYVDGFQFENSPYPTTYIDGDQRGLVPTETAYAWTGAAHASTSTRAATTRAGGRVVNLSEWGFELTGVLGLGLQAADHYGLDTNLDFSFYLSSSGGARRFTLTGELSGPDFASFLRRRESLEDALRYNRSRIRQPLALVLTLVDPGGQEIGQPLTIYALYDGGLEGEMTSLYSERLALKFLAFDPLLYGEGESGAALAYSDSLTMNYYLQRSASEIWSAPGTALNGALTRFLYRPEDGKVYAIGAFTKTASAPRYRGFTRWGSADWEELSPNAPTSFTAARAIARDASGNLYIGGRFTGYNGVANTNHIARFDGSTYTALGTGVTAPATPDVNALAVRGDTNVLYVGGNIDQVNGATAVSKLAAYDLGAGTWSNVVDADGVGLGLAVDALLHNGRSGNASYLFIGFNGSYNKGGRLAHYITSYGRVQLTDYPTITYGTGFFVKRKTSISDLPYATGVNGRVYAIAQHPLTGDIYIGGAFSQRYGPAGLEACGRVAVHTGNNVWSQVGGGVDGDVHDLWFDPSGNLYVAGDFTSCGGQAGYNGLAMWNGSSWQKIGLDIIGGQYTAVLVDPSGRMHVGSDAVQTAYWPGQVTVTNQGRADAYPELRFTGPGSISYLANITTGAVLNLGLTLATGETATLRLDPATGVSFTTSLQGDVMRYVLPGSTLPFALAPGANVIALFISGAAAGTAAVMAWREGYLSLAGGVR